MPKKNDTHFEFYDGQEGYEKYARNKENNVGDFKPPVPVSNPAIQAMRNQKKNAKKGKR